MNFDKAGIGLAQQHVAFFYNYGESFEYSGNVEGTRTSFLAGRNSCREALRVAARALEGIDADDHENLLLQKIALDLLKSSGCYVERE